MAVEARFIESKSEERVGSIVVPACSPDREEHLYLIGEAVGGVHERRFLPILRDHCGRITRLGPVTGLPPEPAEGRFANLLPQCPITDEVRTLPRRCCKPSARLRPNRAILTPSRTLVCA